MRIRRPSAQLELWERWEQPAMAALPYVMLVIVASMTVAIKWGESAGDLLIDLGLAAAAGAWMLWNFTLHPAWRQRPRRMVIFFIVLAILMALLVLRAPWYGFFTFTGYLYAFYLPTGRARAAGVALIALITATSQNGGLPKHWTAGAVVIYLVIICINVVVAGALTWFGWVSAQQNDQRKQMVEELSEANRRLESILEENQGLHDQLLAQAREAGVLDERQRMAREIHDTLAQGLTGIITQLQAAERHGQSQDERRLAHRAGHPAGQGQPDRGPPVGPGHAARAAGVGPAARGTGRRRQQVDADPRGARYGHDHRPATADPARCRDHPAARRAGGAGQRGPARPGGQGRADPVLHGGSGEPGYPRRRRGLRPAAGRRHRARPGGRQRVRPAGHAAAGRGRGRDPGGRVRARRRHRGLGQRAHGRWLVSAAPIRLLIADDHPVVRDGLSGMFSGDDGFEVIGEAANGAQAVTLACALEPDVILMDLRMPEMDGVAAIAELARRKVAARVLVLTTYDTDSDVVRAVEAGATGYLLKDSPRGDLLRAVRAAARGEAALSPSVATRLLGQVRAPAQEPLSQREFEVLELVARGATNREAAAKLFISEATVKTHLLHIYAKLGVSDRAAAVAEGFQRGLLRQR